jgi:hypothetical protein
MKKVLPVILFLISSVSYSSELLINRFVADVKGGKEIYTSINYQDCKIIKIEHDLDNNGESDFLLSSDCPYGDTPSWGNAGGNWKVYFSSNKGFIEGTTIFFHPLAVQFEPTGVEKEFYYTMYWKYGCCEGTLSKNIASLETNTVIDNEYLKETNVEGGIGYEKYKVLFRDKKPIASSNCTIKEIDTNSCLWKNGYY